MTIALFMDKYAGGILSASFFLMMGYLFYWIVVVQPHKVRKVYAEMVTKGYSSIEAGNPTIKNILNLLAPIFPIDPRIKEAIVEWTCRNIVMLKKHNYKRIIINACRLNADSALRGPSSGRSATERTTTILMEEIETPFNVSWHLVPCDNTSSIKWEKRHGLNKVTSEPIQDLLQHYQIYTKSGQVEMISHALSKALIQICPVLTDKSHFCFQHGVTIKFGSNGWGICTSNRIHTKKDMDMLIDIADILHKTM